jgi:hypothetical protein
MSGGYFEYVNEALRLTKAILSDYSMSWSELLLDVQINFRDPEIQIYFFKESSIEDVIEFDIGSCENPDRSLQEISTYLRETISDVIFRLSKTT